MRYADNVDYLVASIIYLGTHSYYWARSPDTLSIELGLDEQHLMNLFNSFPSIFRKSQRTNDNGQHYYSLQARYALRDGGDTKDLERLSEIKPLSSEQIELLTNFVVTMTEHERAERRNWLTSGIAVSAAIISAGTAILVAILKT